MDTIHENDLIWDEFNSNHINKHYVSRHEVVEACSRIVHTEKTKYDRLLIVGITNNNRILSMVISTKDSNHYYLVTARDASKKERKIYAKKQKEFNS